jgi:hypothetical protein
MATNKVLDLNGVDRSTLELTLQDDERTRVRISMPTEGLMQELQSAAPEMIGVMKSGSKDGIREIYDLAARLISCNRDFLKITGEELRDKYRMDLESAVIFFSAYLDFINDIIKEKN